MLEIIDLNKKLEKEEFHSIISGLQLTLAELQRQAKELKIPVIVVFEGLDAAGKGTLINDLILPMDPRVYSVYPTYASNEEERLRPFLWRFWIKTPAKGRIAIFDRSWYRRVLTDRIENNMKQSEISKAFQEINYFEEQLADDGNVIIKFFLYISKEEQKNRLRKLESNPSTSWRVTKEDWKHYKQYSEYVKAADQMIEKTDTDYAPWTVVEAHDRRFAVVKIFNTVISALQSRIREVRRQRESENNAVAVTSRLSTVNISALNASILDKIDLGKILDKEEYKLKLKQYQERIRELEHEIYIRRVPVVIVYEGWDAAGKGGNIRRLTENLDPRGYGVFPTAAPNDIEKAHHYLWRFWNEMPKAGHITIFDRSWYGRVLVERIEGFCTEEEWKRAYKEINEMEEHLHNFGTVIIKFWMHIDKEEQLRRFKERQEKDYKRWKITEEDWRNREKWDSYKQAAEDMLFKTSTTYAPWTIIEANSKHYARIKALKTVVETIEERLK
ncbi:MAG: polyphosphate:AMP phosphotransferase [Bacillota bacterium]